MESSRLCVGCWPQIHMPIVLRGPPSIPFRIDRIGRSGMNPNVCRICERHLSRVKKAKQVSTDATVLFADIGGYTGLSQAFESSDVAHLLGAFYGQRAKAVWRIDGLINKPIGDAVLAIFSSPGAAPDHVRRAAQSALAPQDRCTRMQSKAGLPHEAAYRVPARWPPHLQPRPPGRPAIRSQYSSETSVVGRCILRVCQRPRHVHRSR